MVPVAQRIDLQKITRDVMVISEPKNVLVAQFTFYVYHYSQSDLGLAAVVIRLAHRLLQNT